MTVLTPCQRATRDGVRAAQEEHQRLATAFHARVEIFDVIEGERIWLFFRRLHSLYGAYQRYGETAGIVINAQHPLTLQRTRPRTSTAITSLVMPQAPTMSTASTEGRKTSRRPPLRHSLASS